MLLAVVGGAMFSGQIMGIVSKIPGVGGMLAGMGDGGAATDDEA